MNKNESREERKKQEQMSGPSKQSNLGKIYYWVIGILFFILLLLIFFIFSRSGKNIDVDSDGDESSLVEMDPDNADESSDTDNTEIEDDDNDNTTDQTTEDSTDTETDIEDTNEDSENDSDEESAENNETDDLEPGESTVVDDAAPHDSDYAVNYDEGSADRIEIKNLIMAVTGLDADLIEWRVENNGPGRVQATVTNRSQTETYRVDLQYGEGNWHVTSYERLNSNPFN